jgi:hypothetical protein
MRRDLLKQMTWEDVVEIVNETESLFDGEVEKGYNPNVVFTSPEAYYNEVLRRLREKYGIPPPVEERYPTVLKAAEQATSWMLTDSRERENTLIRSFVAYKLREEGYSYADIGKMMKRDHSTITHLANRMRDMLSLPNAYKWEVQQYKRFEEML